LEAGIFAWVIGDRSAATFKWLWNLVKCWQCFFYVTDGSKVYPIFISEGDQIVSLTYMTRAWERILVCGITRHGCTVKQECYSKSALDVEVFPPLAEPLFEISDSSFASLVHYSFSNTKVRLQ